MGKLECLVKETEKFEGKDIGAILGFDKYRSIEDVYAEKIGEIEFLRQGLEVIYWTSTLEEVVSREFMIRTKKKIRKNNINSVDKDYEYMVSNVNRKIIGENSILDCKVINGIDEAQINDKNFIRMRVLEAQHNMKVKEVDKCYIAMLINGRKFILKEIKRDESLISKIVKVEEKFWNYYIKKKVKPNESLSLD
ncbi:YqaJ viral recombinase family protein [Clostridium sp. DL-VIII]|uniref:YqaJ viral recombinase family protein n=1 Tax=Clostridium sp. DL-VIII TaxID=641107 RepID=UPI0002FF3157|nr:YqaJ viral recombinase family protein [Clostridium sp. DL-VIII]